MIKKLNYLIICLLIIISPFSAKGQDIVDLVVSGTGTTKEQATLQALRSALEQTYGCFLSSNTRVIDDILVNEDISTITQGNIVSFKEIASSHLNSNLIQVTLQTTVSISKLSSFAKVKSKDASIVFDGSILNMNIKLYELNKKNEKKVLQDLYQQLSNIPNIFSVDEVKLSEPILDRDGENFNMQISAKIVVNEYGPVLSNIFYSTLQAISDNNKKMIKQYKSLNLDFFQYLTPKSKPGTIRVQYIILLNSLKDLWGESGMRGNMLIHQNTVPFLFATDIFYHDRYAYYSPAFFLLNNINSFGLVDNNSYPQESGLRYGVSMSSSLYGNISSYDIIRHLAKLSIDKQGKVVGTIIFHIAIPKDQINNFSKFEILELRKKREDYRLVSFDNNYQVFGLYETW